MSQLYAFCTIKASLKTADPHDWYWDETSETLSFFDPSQQLIDDLLIPLLGPSWTATHYVDADPTDDTTTIYERGTERPVAVLIPLS